MKPADQLSFDQETSILTIEPFEGIAFLVGGKETTGEVKITRPTTVRARPRGRLIDKGARTEWKINPTITQVDEPSSPTPVDNPNPENPDSSEEDDN